MTNILLDTALSTESAWVAAFTERLLERGDFARGPTMKIARVLFGLCGHLPPADMADDHLQAWAATFSRSR